MIAKIKIGHVQNHVIVIITVIVLTIIAPQV